MIKIEGKHNAALCFAATLDEGAVQQIQAVCDQEAFAGCKICQAPIIRSKKP